MAEDGRPAWPAWVNDKAVRYLWRPRHSRGDEPRRLSWPATAVISAVILGIAVLTFAALRNHGRGDGHADVSLPIPTLAAPVGYPSATPTPTPSVSYSPISAAPPVTPPRQSMASEHVTSPVTTAHQAAWGQKVIAATSALTTGQSWSTNRLRLTVTAGGNLILQDQGRTVWQTCTTTGVKLVMQNDGHLVLYDRQNGTAWSSGTAGNPGAVLILRADGNMVISLNGRILFQTGTGD